MKERQYGLQTGSHAMHWAYLFCTYCTLRTVCMSTESYLHLDLRRYADNSRQYHASSFVFAFSPSLCASFLSIDWTLTFTFVRGAACHHQERCVTSVSAYVPLFKRKQLCSRCAARGFVGYPHTPGRVTGRTSPAQPLQYGGLTPLPLSISRSTQL